MADDGSNGADVEESRCSPTDVLLQYVCLQRMRNTTITSIT